MNALVIATISFTSAVTCYAGVDLFRRQSLVRNWFDVPNERSSHTRPTPRGGGVVIVIICLAGYVGMSFLTVASLSWGYVVGALMLAIVSWIDDRYSISAVWRLPVHFVSSILLVVSVGPFESVGLPSGEAIRLAFLAPAITVLWIVWMINAYNFMDGIDGIAGVQAIVASTGWAIVTAMLGASQLAAFSLIVLGSSAGFLAHNWRPARVFMGDVGSAFLGYTFAAIPLLAARAAPNMLPWLPVAGLFLLWPFAFDSAFTILRRMLRGQKIWEAHREHLYQRLILAGYSHSTVSIIYLAFAILSAIDLFVAIKFIGKAAVASIILLFLMTSIFMIIISVLTGKMGDKELDLTDGTI